jgi:hypothetical protein
MLTANEVLSRFENDPCRDKNLTDEEKAALDRALDTALHAIARHPTWKQAEPDLLSLGDLQRLMATLAFRFGVRLTERQIRLVREFDRCDVPEVRRKIYQAIKKGEFS